VLRGIYPVRLAVRLRYAISNYNNSILRMYARWFDLMGLPSVHNVDARRATTSYVEMHASMSFIVVGSSSSHAGELAASHGR